MSQYESFYGYHKFVLLEKIKNHIRGNVKPKKRVSQQYYATPATEQSRQYAAQAMQRNASKNKEKHKAVYDQFYERGGFAWYEALTGDAVDVERIYWDIGYFLEILKHGLLVEENRVIESQYADIKREARESARRKIVEMARMIGRGDEISHGEYRRALVYLGTSSWADMDKIKKVYQERDRMNEETGEIHHVDHIVPIVHDKVCGLHNQFNLRVITGYENMCKSNNFSSCEFQE